MNRKLAAIAIFHPMAYPVYELFWLRIGIIARDDGNPGV